MGQKEVVPLLMIVLGIRRFFDFCWTCEKKFLASDGIKVKKYFDLSCWECRAAKCRAAKLD